MATTFGSVLRTSSRRASASVLAKRVGIAQWTVRSVATLSGREYIYVHPSPSTSKPQSYILSLLPTSPPTPSLALGTTTVLPPTPNSTTENPHFFDILHSVLAHHAAHDPSVQADAKVYASQAGSSLGGGNAFSNLRSPNSPLTKKRSRTESGAGGASAQGGIGGGAKGGWVHVSDERNVPDFGRTAWPEDIFGSVEIDAQGELVDGHGRYQPAGTYRLVTNEGVLGLSKYLRERVVERLKELESEKT